MSSELGKIRVEKSKLGWNFLSSEDIWTLYEWLCEGTTVCWASKMDRNSENSKTEVTERVEHDTNELVPKGGAVSIVLKFFGLNKKH